MSASPNTILAVVDVLEQREQPVVERAGWLAERVGAAVELFACDYDSDIDAGRVATVWVPEPGVREQLLATHRRRLETLAEPLRRRGIDVSVEVAWDYPQHEAVLRHVAARRPWLVAKNTVHHNIVQRTLLTNTDWQLVRTCPVPLLLVKPREIAPRPIVLAAVDPVHEHDKPAALDDAIYRFAADLADKADGSLQVVHAFSTPLGVELPPDVRERLATEHRDAMASFTSSHAIPAENVHLLEGLAHECLQHAVEAQHADFLVMGVIARRGFDALFIGSTAARVLDRLPCDLIVIKAPGFETPGH
jgi:universal stress protein E